MYLVLLQLFLTFCLAVTAFENMPKRKKTENVDTALFCICKRPNDNITMMLACDFCDEWFHPACMGMDEKEAEAVTTWHCPACIDFIRQDPTVSKQGLLGFQGRVAPKEGWNCKFPVTNISETVIQTDTQRHCIEGYNLFRENKVTSLSTNIRGIYTYFKSTCLPDMKTDKPYNIFLCMKNVTSDAKIKWIVCSCPAGIDGQCKHSMAVLYFIIDLTRQGADTIPESLTCTSKLQTWHVQKPLTDDPLLFRELQFVKHQPSKVAKYELSCQAKFHNPVPSFAKSVTSDQIERLVKVHDASGLTMTLQETLEEYSFQPILPKQQTRDTLQTNIFDSIASTNFDISNYTNKLSDSEMRHYQTMVSVDLAHCMQIEQRTRMQSKSSFWYNQRAHRITAYNFGTFSKLRPSTNPVSTFIRCKTIFSNSSVQHGLHNESIALAKFCENNPCINCSVGLLVNPQIPFLGASPDRVIMKDNQLKLVEVKCPYSLFKRKASIKSQLSHSQFYLQSVNGDIQLKQSHDYYYQIQGQLNLSGIDECILVVFVPPSDIVEVIVKRDQDFFQQKVMPKLCDVWFNHVFKHFISDLHR